MASPEHVCASAALNIHSRFCVCLHTRIHYIYHNVHNVRAYIHIYIIIKKVVFERE